MIRARLQRLHIRLLILVLVSVLPAFGIIIYTAAEQRAQALRDADRQAAALTARVAEGRLELIAYSHPAPVDQSVSEIGRSTTWLRKVVASERLPRGSVLTLVDAHGIIRARVPDPEAWVGHPVPDLKFFLKLIADGGPATGESVWLDGVRRITHIARLDNAEQGGIYIRVGIPKDAVFGNLDEILWRNIVLFVFAVLLVLVFGWLASEHLVLRRVRDLAETARRFGAGDLSARLRMAPDGGELGDLARAFEGMVESLEERQRSIEYLAHHDPLTGLPNRLLLDDRFAQATAHADRRHSKVALLYLDLDRFKTINDSLGHPVGDKLLQTLAARLHECIRETDTTSRLGGDEFVVILTDLCSPDTVDRIAQKILEQVCGTVEIDGHTLNASFSIGISLYPDDGGDFDSLLQKSDIAMYHAKEAGRNAYRFFTEQMNVDALERLLIQNRLCRALEQGEFVLHYQPQIDLASGRVIGAEALLRWNNPELGLLCPNRFIALAEESGLIVPIGEWVLRSACAQSRAWLDAGLPPLCVAVNLSARQFWRGDMVALVEDALAETGVAAASLELEVTESAIMRDLEETVAALAGLRALGAAVSIDDFGTGYSSLGYLRRLPLDKLKIDRAFVRDSVLDANAALLVRQIIGIAHALNLTVIAEGVENAAELKFLVHSGCDVVQGFYFSRPLPADEFQAFVEENGF